MDALKEKELYLKTKRNEIEKYKCDLNMLKGEVDVYTNMLEEANKQYNEEEKKLDIMSSKVWEARLKFSEDVKSHLIKYDCLLFNSQLIKENAIKKHDEKNLQAEIEKLKSEIELLENDYQEFKSNLNIIQQLKTNIKILEDEPEVGFDFRRLRSRIESCKEELKQLSWLNDNERSAYSQSQLNTSIGPALSEQQVERKMVYVTPYTTKSVENQLRKGFIAKVPSNLNKKY